MNISESTGTRGTHRMLQVYCMATCEMKCVELARSGAMLHPAICLKMDTTHSHKKIHMVDTQGCVGSRYPHLPLEYSRAATKYLRK